MECGPFTKQFSITRGRDSEEASKFLIHHHTTPFRFITRRSARQPLTWKSPIRREGKIHSSSA